MKSRIAGLLVAMWLLLPAVWLQAAPIRVTTWDLQSCSATNTQVIQSLKKLHPDVILLQQVADRETCDQLAQALQPEVYQVALCSSFRDPRTKLSGRQVAILSKAKAYLAWSQPWQNNGESPAAPGGFAFAAIRLGDKNIGIFSVQLSDGAASGAAFQKACDDSARQLVTQIAFLQNWNTSRLQAFIVAGDFNTAPDVLPLAHEKTLLRLEHIGFESAFASHVQRPATTLDYVFTRDIGLFAPPVTTQSALSGNDAVTIEMNLTAPKALPTPLPPGTSTANLKKHPPAFWLAGCLASSLAFFALARKLLRQLKSQPAPVALPDLKAQTGAILSIPPPESPPYVQVEIEGSTRTHSQTWPPRPDAGRLTARMPEAVRMGVIANLSQWLKEKLVQRLVSDRAQLLAVQQAAALKVLAVDERLAKVEHHIQQRNQEYEQRIDNLLKALVTAREENRELIRAKIALLKAEMEEARLEE